MSSPETTPLEADARAEKFLAGTYRRIILFNWLLAAVALPLLVWRFGWHVAGGLLLGATLSHLNFLWLMTSVTAVIDKILASRSAPPATRIVVRMLGPYALVALIAYVIFKSSVQALYGFFAGLFLPILAAVCEGAYEAIVGARGTRAETK